MWRLWRPLRRENTLRRLKCLDASHLGSFILFAVVEVEGGEMERSLILAATLPSGGDAQVTAGDWERKNTDENNKKVLGGGELSCPARSSLPRPRATGSV